MNKKEPSKAAGNPLRRFNLPKSQILRGRRNFENLFSSSSFLSASTVNLRYAIYPNASGELLVGFIAPKKIGNAVKRIRAKRFLREAYRLNQHIITDSPELSKMCLHFVFMAKHANLTFNDVQHDVIQLMTKLREQLLSETSPL
ncbi:MAG: ribonuclease P protein component [Balneolaceae bacterium]